MSDKAKTRISVTMTKPYLEALDRLVEEGIYLSKGAIILDALRVFLRQRGIEPFAGPSEEQVEEAGRSG